MRIEYDQQADALYIYIQEDKYVAKSREIGEGLILDLDKSGRVIGLEVLGLSTRYKKTNISQFSLQNLITSKTLTRV